MMGQLYLAEIKKQPYLPLVSKMAESNELKTCTNLYLYQLSFNPIIKFYVNERVNLKGLKNMSIFGYEWSIFASNPSFCDCSQI